MFLILIAGAALLFFGLATLKQLANKQWKLARLSAVITAAALIGVIAGFKMVGGPSEVANAPEKASAPVVKSEPEPPAPAKRIELPPTAEIAAQKTAEKEFESAEAGWTESEKFLLITAVGKENLTVNMMRNGVLIGISNTLKALKDHPEIKNVRFDIKMPLTDEYGNSSDQSVVRAEFNRGTLDKINWDQFLFSNIPDVADEFWQHPAMDK